MSQQLYLLSAFYDISTPTILSSLLIDFASTYIPFRLLRPLAPTHSGSSRVRIPNKEIANDYSIQALSTILASAIYSVTIFTAYKTVLPRILALDFEGIKSLEDVYRLHWLPLLPLMAGFGAAVKEFVFTPALVVVSTPQDLRPVTLYYIFFRTTSNMTTAPNAPRCSELQVRRFIGDAPRNYPLQLLGL